MTPFGIGLSLQHSLRLGLGRQDTLDGTGGISAEAHGTLKSRQQVLAGIRSQQGQHPAGLTLAVTLIAQQAVEEAARLRSQPGEALTQER